MEFLRQYRRRVGQIDIAERAFDDEAGLGQPRRPARAHEEDDVAAGRKQAAAEIAADGAGADHENAHSEFLRGCKLAGARL